MSQPEPHLPESLTAREAVPRPPLWSVWFGLTDEVPRGLYAVSGFLLMLLKYCVEAVAVFVWADRLLTPLEFTLFWAKHVPMPWEFLGPLINGQSDVIAQTPDWLGWVMLIWTLPFVWVSFSMSLRRAANAGLTPWLGALILIPLLNLVVMLILAAVPTRRVSTWNMTSPPSTPPPDRLQRAPRAILATIAGVLVGLASLALAIYAWREYGVTLFFGAPVLMGCLTGFVYNYRYPQSWRTTVGISLLMIVVTGGCLLAFALEGIICLLMAAPLVMPLAVFGALLGKAVACATHTSMPQTVGMLLILPVMAGVEGVQPPAAPEYVVTSVVEIDAPPGTV